MRKQSRAVREGLATRGVQQDGQRRRTAVLDRTRLSGGRNSPSPAEARPVRAPVGRLRVLTPTDRRYATPSSAAARASFFVECREFRPAPNRGLQIGRVVAAQAVFARERCDRVIGMAGIRLDGQHANVLHVVVHRADFDAPFALANQERAAHFVPEEVRHNDAFCAASLDGVAASVPDRSRKHQAMAMEASITMAIHGVPRLATGETPRGTA